VFRLQGYVDLDRARNQSQNLTEDSIQLTPLSNVANEPRCRQIGEAVFLEPLLHRNFFTLDRRLGFRLSSESSRNHSNGCHLPSVYAIGTTTACNLATARNFGVSLIDRCHARPFFRMRAYPKQVSGDPQREQPSLTNIRLSLGGAQYSLSAD
jgi:hypothetical protein